jgi:hypothetical integral membrane protein (TIGR02206 family)
LGGPLVLEHVLTLAVITMLIAALLVSARRRPGDWTLPAGRLLAIVILANEAGWWVWLAFQHTWSLSYALPLHLCDVAAFVSAAALWTRRPLLVELTYFWGLAGTSNSLFTPDLAEHFPRYLFFQYYIAHGAIVAAALFLVFGLRITPRRGAVARVVALTLGLAAFDSVVNLVTGGNYMFLRQAPGVHSLLDLMGPWPWYVFGAAVLALALFAALNLPFWVGRRLAHLPPVRPPMAPTAVRGDPRR